MVRNRYHLLCANGISGNIGIISRHFSARGYEFLAPVFVDVRLLIVSGGDSRRRILMFRDNEEILHLARGVRRAC